MINIIEFTPAGAREFRKLPAQLQERIVEKIKIYLSTGQPLSFARSLVNLPPATHRFRVGKYRVCFYVEAAKLIIDGVDTREDAYRRK